MRLVTANPFSVRSTKVQHKLGGSKKSSKNDKTTALAGRSDAFSSPYLNNITL